MAVKAISFATNIVEVYQKGSYQKQLSPIRLQRLVFLFHLHYLKDFSKHFVEDEFVAFKLGGIVREVYSNYRVFFRVIDKPATFLHYESMVGGSYLPYPGANLNDKDEYYLLSFIQRYMDLDEWQLADICIELMKTENIIENSIITKRQLLNMSNHLEKISDVKRDLI